MAESRSEPWARKLVGLLKIAAVTSFLAMASAAGAKTRDEQAIFVGLVLCALGDVLLIRRGTGLFFRLGLASFLLGHVGYLVASLLFGVDLVVSACALLALSLPAALISRWLWGLVDTKMRPAIVAYICVITTMVAAAVGRAVVDENAGALLCAAAVLFWCSDLFVARQRFVAPRFLNKLFGLPLYFAAQLCFAASLW